MGCGRYGWGGIINQWQVLILPERGVDHLEDTCTDDNTVKSEAIIHNENASKTVLLPVEGRLKVNPWSKCVHADKHLCQEQTQEDILRYLCNNDPH